MESLMDSISGAYRIVTEASSYVIDLDRMVVCRSPRTGDRDGSLLRRDEELITLLEILECSVGRPMTLMIDLHVAGIPFTTRISTPVISIEQVHSPGEQASR